MEKTDGSGRRNAARGIIAFVLCMWLSMGARAQNPDIDLLKGFNHSRSTGVDPVMVGVTNSVYPIAAIVPLTELAIGYKKHDVRMIQRGWSSVAGIGINFIVTFGTKYAVDRPRPYATYSFINPYQHDKDPSFPSGHTSFAFNMATSLYLDYPHWYVAVPAYTYASLVGYSRLYLGMHYPSDVLVGAAVGAGSAWLGHKLWNKLYVKHRKHVAATTHTYEL